jgi:hypothetical protein
MDGSTPGGATSLHQPENVAPGAAERVSFGGQGYFRAVFSSPDAYLQMLSFAKVFQRLT